MLPHESPEACQECGCAMQSNYDYTRQCLNSDCPLGMVPIRKGEPASGEPTDPNPVLQAINPPPLPGLEIRVKILALASQLIHFPGLHPEAVARAVGIVDLCVAPPTGSAEAPAPRPMEWTKEKPKVEGWYWVTIMHGVRVVELRNDEAGVLRPHWPGGWDYTEEKEWSGPILPPSNGGETHGE